MRDGEIEAVEKGIIAVQIDGKVHYLSRYCTHEGADLSLGYVDDDKQLRCPWHNLRFSKEGKQPCKTLKDLKTYSKVDGKYVAD